MRLLSFGLFLGFLAGASPLHAADVRGTGPETPDPNAKDQTAHYWDSGEIRPFLSGQLQVGALNRVIVAAGYGRPHYLWGGVEVCVFRNHLNARSEIT